MHEQMKSNEQVHLQFLRAQIFKKTQKSSESEPRMNGSSSEVLFLSVRLTANLMTRRVENLVNALGLHLQ